MWSTRRHSQGVSLIELIVSTGIAGFVALVAIETSRQRNASSLAQERTMQTASQARQFFDLRGKAFRAATSATLGPVLAKLTPSQTATYFESLALATSTAGAGSFTETLQNDCSVPSQPLPFDLIASERSLLDSCLPTRCRCSNNPGAACTSVPRVTITRSGQPTPLQFPAGNGTGLDGQPIGAALCIQINGTTDTYRDITLQILSFIRTADNRVKMIPYQAAFPRPKQINANSIRVIGNIRE